MKLSRCDFAKLMKESKDDNPARAAARQTLTGQQTRVIRD
jgi:hypothetical protein